MLIIEGCITAQATGLTARRSGALKVNYSSITYEDAMNTQTVSAAKQITGKYIELTLSDPLNGTSTIKRYSAIRGGIAWPTGAAPAYLAIIGQEYIRPGLFDYAAQAGNRVLLMEHRSESLSLSSFFAKITDLAEQFMCRDFYVDMPEERFASGYQNDFDAFCRERNSRASLYRAYDADDFLLGLSRISGAIEQGNLTIPEDSIVREQLRAITKEDLQNSPEETFYAINGLRHVLGSYFRNQPVLRNSHGIRMRDRLRKYKGRPGGAMAA